MAKYIYLTNVDFNGNEIQNVIVEKVAGAATISSPVAGRIIFDTADNKFKYFNGTSWIAGAEYAVANSKTPDAGEYSILDTQTGNTFKFKVFTAKKGLKLDNATTGVLAFEGVVDPDSEAFLTVGDAGFKLSGVQDAIDTAKDAAINAAATDASAKDEVVKSELIGGDTDGTTTKTIAGAKEFATKAVEAEKTRAEAAEGANATAAANALAEAKKKISKISGSSTVTASTTGTEVALDLAISENNKGNVTFTKAADGLAASVTIPAETFTGVKEGDKVLSKVGTEVASTITFGMDAEVRADGKKYIWLRGIDQTEGAELGKVDVANFVKDAMLNGVELVKDPADHPAGTYLHFTFNLDASQGGHADIYVNVTDLIDVYVQGEGITITGKTIAVNWDAVARVDDLTTEVTRATGAEKGLDEKITAEKNRAEGVEATLQGTITKETKDRIAADTALGERIDGVITDYQAADTKTLEDAKKYADSKITDLGAVAHYYASANVTTGNSVAITAATHKCGTFPQVQVYWKGQQVLANVVIAANGDVTVSWNGTIASTANPIKVIIVG